MQFDGERSDEKPAGETHGRREHRFARPRAFDPAAEDRGRESKEDDREAEDPADRAELPVVRPRLRASDQARERQVEHAERVRLADGEMDGKRDRAFAIEKREKWHRQNLRACERLWNRHHRTVMRGYNFTERVRKSLAYAREEASRLHHEYVGTEHMLLGLL